MTSQMQGEILFDGWSGSGDNDWVYTPWMPVRGNYATFGVQVLANESSITLGWEVQTRTAESPATTTIITGQTLTTVGIGQATNITLDPVTRCQQLFRYRFKTSATADPTKCVIFRALMPSWQTDR